MRIIHDTETIAGIDTHWSFRLAPAHSGRIFVLCCSMLASLTGQLPKRAHSPRAAAHRIAPHKPCGDFLAQGHAWINPEQTGRTDAVGVSIELNEYRKELVVLGDRHWEASGIGRRATAPRPFDKLPVAYELAFGGPGYAWNPVGRGHGYGPAGVRLPNIVYPKQPVPRSIERPVPAGFGPLEPTWLPRSANLGTYDETWLEHQWPGLPRDFDAAHWSEAPEDQRFADGFRGDERLAFDNMHPQYKRLEARLPGCRARAFLATADDGFHELVMRLDTVDADLDEAQVELVWRGSVPVRSPRLPGIDFLFTLVEQLEANTEATLCRARFEAARRQRYPSPAENEEAREMAREAARKETEDKMRTLTAAFQDAIAKSREAAGQKHATRAQSSGVAAAAGAPTVAKRRDEDSAAALQRAVAQLKARNPEQGARLDGTVHRLHPMVSSPPAPPPATNDADQRKWTRERVIATHAAGGDMANANLTGLDLSSLDLSRAKFGNAVMVGVDLTGTNLSRSLLSGARLTGAKLTSARFDGARLSRTSFVGLDCSQLRFEAAEGEMADFRGANLDACNFAKARLTRADFSETRLDDAMFDGATLAAAKFTAARGQRVSFAGCDLTNLRAHGAALPDLSCARATAPHSVWQNAALQRADFSRAMLTRAIFSEAELTEAMFDRAWMDDANLDDAILLRAVLTNARLLRISLERAVLTDADMRSSNLYRAGLFEARAERTQFGGSLLVGTLLSG